MEFDTTMVHTARMAEDDGYIRITLRIPREVHAQLTASAAARSHSMNAEIIRRLEQSLAAGDVGQTMLAETLGLINHLKRAVDKFADTQIPPPLEALALEITGGIGEALEAGAKATKEAEAKAAKRPRRKP